MILALIGPHGAGKTTLGHALADRLGLPFHSELGRELAEDPAWRPRGGTAQDQAEDFDRELFAREQARDLAHRGQARIVETWHPGNLAYAARRSPVQAAAWLPALAAACHEQQVVVLPVFAPAPVLAARQSEPGEAAFFAEVGAAAIRWADALGLPRMPSLDTSRRSPEQLAARVARRLGSPSLSLAWRLTCVSS